MPIPHPKGKGSGRFCHISWDSLKLIAFRFEKSNYQSYLLLFFVSVSLIYVQSYLPLGVVWTSAIVRWMRNFFLILCTVPRNVAKATRPFPFRVWSGHEANLRGVKPLSGGGGRQIAPFAPPPPQNPAVTCST